MKIKREKFTGRTSSVLRTLGVAAVVLAAILVAGGFLAAQYGFFGGGTNAPSVPEDTMTRGLVGYWSMDEGTGSTAYDGSGDGNDGTIYGAQWTKGKNGGALQFDGKDDYVEVPNSDSLDITDAITIEAWVKLNQYTPVRQGIVGKHYYQVYKYGITEQNEYLTFWSNNSVVNNIGSNSKIPLNELTHLSVTVDSSNVIKFYINGLLDKTSSLSTKDFSGAESIIIGGTRPSETTTKFNGTIDEVRIYNRALSAEEVRYHYNHGGPVAHWKFDEGSGTTIHDSSGNGHNGTLTP